MTNIEYLRTLYAYNYWARDRLFVAMEGMSQAEYEAQNEFTYGSIRGILTHCFQGERHWRHRFEGKVAEPLSEEELATPALLAENWQQEANEMRELLARLRDLDLMERFSWRRRDGAQGSFSSLLIGLAHIANHSTQHRSEAAEALTMIGRSPGDLDILVYDNVINSVQS